MFTVPHLIKELSHRVHQFLYIYQGADFIALPAFLEPTNRLHRSGISLILALIPFMVRMMVKEFDRVNFFFTSGY
jgi:hypothetical protein